jgi:hypothetical protein
MRQVPFLFVYSSDFDVSLLFVKYIALMMVAARTSETSVDNYFTRQYIRVI